MLQLYAYFDDDPKTDHVEKFPFGGQIYVKAGNIYFPSNGWYDLPSSVLSMWLWRTAEFISDKEQSPYDLHFMDGPYLIRLSPTNQKNIVSAMFIRNDTIVTAVIEEIDFQAFVQQLLDVVQKLIEDERASNFISAIDRLKKAKERLLKAL